MELVLGDGVRSVQPGSPRKHLLASPGLPEEPHLTIFKDVESPPCPGCEGEPCLEKSVLQRQGWSVALQCVATTVLGGLLPNSEAD